MERPLVGQGSLTDVGVSTNAVGGGRRTTASVDLQTGLDEIAGLAVELVDGHVAMVSVLRDGHVVPLGVAGPLAADDAPGDRLPLEGSVCTVVRDEGSSVAVDDAAVDSRLGPGSYLSRLGIRAFLGAPIVEPDGDVIGVVCVGTDTTRHWRAVDTHALEALARFAGREIERLRATSEALERAQELALVVGRLRHELYGDLTVILGGIETALHPAITADLRTQALTNARGDALRVIDVMDALLRTDARTGVTTRPTTPERIVDDAIRPIRESDRARLAISASDDEVVVAGALVSRVVANLVENALKHTSGTVEVTARAHPRLVEVVVADDGDGLSDDAIAQLYEPFSRGRDTGDDDGFGLGMFIVRELVDRLEGTIEVDSGADGARVTVQVPDRGHGDDE